MGKEQWSDVLQMDRIAAFLSLEDWLLEIATENVISWLHQAKIRSSIPSWNAPV